MENRHENSTSFENVPDTTLTMYNGISSIVKNGITLVTTMLRNTFCQGKKTGVFIKS